MKVPFYYPLGLNVINVAPYLILVNGVPVAKSFKEFANWFKKNELDVTKFKNWPFIEGISEPITERKFNSNPGLDKEELVQAMLGTNQFKRKEMQKAAARIRNRLANKPKE